MSTARHENQATAPVIPEQDNKVQRSSRPQANTICLDERRSTKVGQQCGKQTGTVLTY